jgi:hypothetical protein
MTGRNHRAPRATGRNGKEVFPACTSLCDCVRRTCGTVFHTRAGPGPGLTAPSPRRPHHGYRT